jgi:apolipoprotein N-acyltransferase
MIPARKPARAASVLFDLGLLALSALLFALSFPSFLSQWGWFPLGFVCLVPLFVVVHRASWPAIPFYGIFFGYVSYAIFNFWLGKFHPLTLIVVPPIYAGWFLLTLPALKLADTLFPSRGFLVQVPLWICYEAFLKSKGYLAYAYGIMGYTQYQFLPFIQVADLAGVWLVSALVVYPSALIASGLKDGLAALRGGWRRLLVPALGYAAAFAAVIAYGVLSPVQTRDLRQWKVALVQQNIDPWRGGYPAYRDSLDILIRLSDTALAAGPDLVAWSETSFVPAIDWHTRYRTDQQIFSLVKRLRTYLDRQTVPFLVGNDDGQLRRRGSGEEVRVDYNAAILFDRGRIVDTYRKLHLVPFTEHFPDSWPVRWMRRILVSMDTHFWEKGEVPTVFEAGGVRFSTPICFEDTFGYLCRRFFLRGADVLVNITNDAWSFSVAGAMQHMSMAVFRAVENRRSVVRSTNAGITCAIDPNGRILASLPAFTEGTLLAVVPIVEGPRTLYTAWGDWLPWVCAGVSAAALAAGILRRLTGRGNWSRMKRNETEGPDTHRR